MTPARRAPYPRKATDRTARRRIEAKVVRRGRIDYRMARRALIREVTNGLKSPGDVCDAHPDLIRAGRNIGEHADDPCPICSAEELRLVTYVFGYGKGTAKEHGRAMARHALGALSNYEGDIAAYVVEVCTACSWHHLRESFWLGRAPAG